MNDSESAVDAIWEDIIEIKLHVESNKNRGLVMSMQEMLAKRV